MTSKAAALGTPALSVMKWIQKRKKESPHGVMTWQ